MNIYVLAQYNQSLTACHEAPMIRPCPELTVAKAAVQLGMTRERVIRRIQTRQLEGRRDAERGWLVSADSIAAYVRSQQLAAEKAEESETR